MMYSLNEWCWCIGFLLDFVGSLEDLYAFQYTALDITQRHVGWNFFDLQSEFLRMGVPNDNWVLSQINKEYEVKLMLLRDSREENF
jgi:hypothetical protein